MVGTNGADTPASDSPRRAAKNPFPERAHDKPALQLALAAGRSHSSGPGRRSQP